MIINPCSKEQIDDSCDGWELVGNDHIKEKVWGGNVSNFLSGCLTYFCTWQLQNKIK